MTNVINMNRSALTRCTTNAAFRHAHPARGRRLVLVDIENIVGGVVRSIDEAAWARRWVTAAAGVTTGEHVIIGVSHYGMLSSGLGWPGARLVVRSGADGADLALLEVLADERVEARFDEVLLVTGDGIFADEVARLGGAGVRVTILAHPGACSRRLAIAGARVMPPHGMQVNYGGVA